jgi:hypothetical protein
MEVDSPNWYEHENEKGFRWLGMQPITTDIHMNQGAVVVQFADDRAGAAFQVVMTHASFRDFVMIVVAAREKLEAKLDRKEDFDE